MGNSCCGGDADSVEQQSRPSSGKPTKAFQGEGHRLGTVQEQQQRRNGATDSSPSHKNQGDGDKDDEHKPIVNPILSAADREQQRKERLAAIEARMKKQGVPVNPKKKKQDPNAPLVGPNSKPTMTWQVG